MTERVRPVWREILVVSWPEGSDEGRDAEEVPSRDDEAPIGLGVAIRPGSPAAFYPRLMPLVSVITAAWAPSSEHLQSAATSVLGQQLPDGWELEWIVQEDGEVGGLREALPADERVRYACNGIRAGIAGTRNLALSRARGEWIRVLDHDDLILDGALERQIAAITSHRRATWVGGPMLIRREDGGLEDDLANVPAGLVPAGWVMDQFRRTEFFAVWCGNLLMRTDLVRALGGWGGLPRSEDLFLVGALSQISEGVWLEEPVGEYRIWTGQTVATPAWAAQREAAWAAVIGRVDALRDLKLPLPGRGTPPRRRASVRATRPAPSVPHEDAELSSSGRIGQVPLPEAGAGRGDEAASPATAARMNPPASPGYIGIDFFRRLRELGPAVEVPDPMTFLTPGEGDEHEGRLRALDAARIAADTGEHE